MSRQAVFIYLPLVRLLKAFIHSVFDKTMCLIVVARYWYLGARGVKKAIILLLVDLVVDVMMMGSSGVIILVPAGIIHPLPLVFFGCSHFVSGIVGW